MSSPYFQTGRTITVDNFFTSIHLAQNLWSNGLKIVGTLRVNKREIPIEFKPNKEREVFSSIYGFNSYLSIVSYVPKVKKSVILLSSHHHYIGNENTESKKPDIITFYNKNKGGVDNLDKMIANYSCERKTKRWTLKFFMYLVDVAVQNSFALYKYSSNENKNNQSKVFRRKSIEGLAFEIMKPFIVQRVNSMKENNFRGIEMKILDCIRRTGVEIDKLETKKASKKTKNRCENCPRYTDKKTKNTCSRCEKFLCNLHLFQLHLCQTCYNDIQSANFEETRLENSWPSSNLRKTIKN